MATSWGTRRALGRRYSVDPALELERQRLEQEYGLAPGREARGMQASQFQQQFAYNASEAEKNRKAAASSGMVQTATGALTNAAMLRALTMEKGQPFFGNWGGGSSLPPTTPTPTYTPGMGTAPYATPTTPAVNPVLIDTGGGLATEGAGMTATEGAVMTAAEASPMAGFAGFASKAGPIAAIIGGALAAKSKWGGKDIPWDEKTYWQKSTTAPGSFLGAGGLFTNFAKPDTVVGKVGKEMARIEQQAMKPIEAIVNWIGGLF